jgi:hypothetical protein
MKIIFQDVDGPLIPGRLYYSRDAHYNDEKGFFVYDPVAVGMIRELCKRFDAKVVYNTAHNETDPGLMFWKARMNDMDDLLHDDCRTGFRVECYSKKDAIVTWLRNHPEVTEWIVIDDETIFDGDPQVKVDFNLGLTIDNFFKACALFGDKPSSIILAGAK